jgi:hypothetical protein
MIGYEGYIKVGSIWALGTGSAMPESRVRLDSSGGYGGDVSGANMGIGNAHVYDWSNWDGSIDFEMTSGMFTELKSWLNNRDALRAILISSRFGNEQVFTEAIWNSISMSASEGSMCAGSVGFVAIERDGYIFGGNKANNSAQGINGAQICGLENIPYWETGISGYNFIDWNLEFAQDVVKFSACNKTNNVVPPIYYGVGPMTITLSGSCIFSGREFDNNIGSLTVNVGDGHIGLRQAELQTQGDDVKTGNALAPISVTIEAYELE